MESFLGPFVDFLFIGIDSGFGRVIYAVNGESKLFLPAAAGADIVLQVDCDFFPRGEQIFSFLICRHINWCLYAKQVF